MSGSIEGLNQATAVALATLMEAMTAWEPLPTHDRTKRYLTAMESMGLTAFEGPLPSQAPAAQALASSLKSLQKSPRPLRVFALQAALEVAMGAGTLFLAQNLALRMVVEALGLTPSDLQGLFRARTGVLLPEPWDPSDRHAWLAREAGARLEGLDWDDAGPYPIGSFRPPAESSLARIERIKALALLGLEEEASPEEIKRAFFRVTKVHHPDHYASEGSEMAAEATRSYTRIKEAYEFLTNQP